MPTLAEVSQSLKNRLAGVPKAQTTIDAVMEDIGDAAEQEVEEGRKAVSTSADIAEKLAGQVRHISPILHDGRPNPEYLNLSPAHKIASTESALRRAEPTGPLWKGLRS